jgi:hypothetical protein
LQDEYNEFCRGYWADPDPKHCGCRGCGWALSDLDTWHQCPYHKGPHPESEPDDPAQCLVGTEENPKMPDDVTDAEMEACEFKPAAPPPPKPLTDADIPF